MRTILHATDYSQKAVPALQYAGFLREALDAKLIVIHVFDYPTVLDTPVIEQIPGIENQVTQEHERKLKAFCSKHLGKDYPTKNISTSAIEDKSIVKAILAKAKEVDAFLIITGTRGGSLIKELVLGNTARQLIKKSPCPVLTVPEDTKGLHAKTLVYATDFQEEDSMAIEQLTAIAKPLDASIHVVHITTDKEYNAHIQMEWFKDLVSKIIDFDNIVYEVLYNEHTFEALRVYCGDIGADMIIMLERNKKGMFENLLHRDLVMQMESYGRIPVLSFNKNTYQFITY